MLLSVNLRLPILGMVVSMRVLSDQSEVAGCGSCRPPRTPAAGPCSIKHSAQEQLEHGKQSKQNLSLLPTLSTVLRNFRFQKNAALLDT